MEQFGVAIGEDAQHPVHEVGLKLHAASGNVNLQAQSGAITVTAQKAIAIQSTAASLTLSAPSSLMLNGSGGYIKINGADIEIGTSGAASFKASAKELTGGGSASVVAPSLARADTVKSPKTGLFSQRLVVDESLSSLLDPPSAFNIRVHQADGLLIHEGQLLDDWRSERVFTQGIEQLTYRLERQDKTWQSLSTDLPTGHDVTDDCDIADFSTPMESDDE